MGRREGFRGTYRRLRDKESLSGISLMGGDELQLVCYRMSGRMVW